MGAVDGLHLGDAGEEDMRVESKIEGYMSRVRGVYIDLGGVVGWHPASRLN